MTYKPNRLSTAVAATAVTLGGRELLFDGRGNPIYSPVVKQSEQALNNEEESTGSSEELEPATLNLRDTARHPRVNRKHSGSLI
jgi:hypothetical protein